MKIKRISVYIEQLRTLRCLIFSLITLLSMHQVASAAILGTWDMTEDVGTATGELTLSGPGVEVVSGEGVSRKGLVFGNNSDRATINGTANNASDPYFPSGSDPSITVEAWVYQAGFQNGKRAIADTQWTNDFKGYGLYLQDGVPKFLVRNPSGGIVIATASLAIDPDRWYHISGTWNAGTDTLKIYVNGVEEGSTVSSGFVLENSSVNPITLGALANGSDPLVGRIDNFRIENAVSPKVFDDYDAGHNTTEGVPDVMSTIDSFVASITMTNMGTVTWTAAEGVKLGRSDPMDSSEISAGRVEIPAGVSVRTGESITFDFIGANPSAVGDVPYVYKMLDEGTVVNGWFGQSTSQSKVITVIFASESSDDGIDDAWEYGFFGDLETATETSDYNGDGLTDLEVYELHFKTGEEWDPTKTNSDSDLLTDLYEATVIELADELGRGPMTMLSIGNDDDYDGDGLDNVDEQFINSQPFNQHTPFLIVDTVLSAGSSNSLMAIDVVALELAPDAAVYARGLLSASDGDGGIFNLDLDGSQPSGTGDIAVTGVSGAYWRKQVLGGESTVISGTPNTVAVFNGTGDDLGDSGITDDGTTIQINRIVTLTPQGDIPSLGDPAP